MIAVSLTEPEFIRVSGADTRQFLQGQLSCDLDKLDPQHSLPGALCNLQGRVIADFRLLMDGDDCLLRTSAGMADRILAVLGKYAVFSKVELSKDESIAATLGVLGNDALAALQELYSDLPTSESGCLAIEGGWILRIPGTQARFEIYCHRDSEAQKLLNRLHLQASPDDGAWRRQDIARGIVHVTPQSSEQYTPQLLNYDISGVIDFKKGCYTGQEVVARMFYRGKAKKRLFLLHSDQAVSDDSKVQLKDAETRDFEILAFSNSESAQDGPHLLLAILDRTIVENKQPLQLSTRAGSSLTVQELAYASEAGGSD